MKNSVKFFVSVCIIVAGLFAVQITSFGQKQSPSPEVVKTDSEKAKVDNEAAEIARARETVRMLDDIYKGGIVTITDQYVTEDSEIPAGTAFKQIFAIAKAKGWHEARLLDVTGDPYNDENVAVDDFEKRGVKKMAQGESFYEEIEETEGKRYLRVMTPIPVVFEKCTWCHSNYEDVPKGKAIGAMGYRMPISGRLKK